MAERPRRKPERPDRRRADGPPGKRRGEPPSGRRARKDERTDRTDRTGRTDRGTGRERKPAKKAAPPEPERKGPKRWGGVARRGAANLGEDQETASRIWRDAVKRARTGDGDGATKPADRDWEPEPWREPAPTRKSGTPAERRPPPRRRDGPRNLAPDVAAELAEVRGPKAAPRMQQRLADAARAYERNRYPDARRLLKALADEAPGAPSVRELHGLVLYELGRWKEAARELEAFRSITGSVDQHPVLADCYRALRRYRVVEELWEELRQASPSAELVAEGRIVAAGARADQGDLRGAIDLIERTRLDVKRPKPHHLRLLYALADLYERAGDVPRARDLFGRIMRHDPAFFDTAERLQAL